MQAGKTLGEDIIFKVSTRWAFFVALSGFLLCVSAGISLCGGRQAHGGGSHRDPAQSFLATYNQVILDCVLLVPSSCGAELVWSRACLQAVLYSFSAC